MKVGGYKFHGENDKINGGGNGTVYRVREEESDDYIALKVLRTGGRSFLKKLKRFKDEVKVVTEYQDKLEGILPIIDYKFDKIEKKYWYTMPIAIPILDRLNSLENKKIDTIIESIIELSTHLSKFHELSIYHRDIKPSNLYYYQEKYCFADFGLVDYPEKDDLTGLNESVGPKATIAPEMKWDATNADGGKADVYSLAKTLWMLLTDNTYSFEGTYDRTSKIMGLRNYYPEEHLVELEKLLMQSTKESPDDRPTIVEFSEKLYEYQVIKNDYVRYNRSQWHFVQEQLFSQDIPERISWSNIDKIVSVLRLIAEMPSLNHMFYPTGGGNDLVDVQKAGEDGFIYLITGVGSKEVVKPKRLHVENFDADFEWSYFRLDLEEVSYVFENSESESRELVTEVAPGHYEDWLVGNYGYYQDGTPVPEGTTLVMRYLKGSFVFFAKDSMYNRISITYDGNHTLVDNDVYRDYIMYLKEGTYLILQIKNNLNLNLDIMYALSKYATLPFNNVEKIVNNLDSQLSATKVLKDLMFEVDTELEEVDDLFTEMDKPIEVDISKCDFSSILYFENQEATVLLYRIKWSSYFAKESEALYLSNNGKFLPLNETTFESNSKKNIIEVYNGCRRICPNNDRKMFSPVFQVVFKRVLFPKNLITKEQIKEVLVKGDDTVGNVLVVDELGYPHLINSSETLIQFYPVRLESFAAYNNYVGKFSKLNHLEETYLICLKAWADHLNRDEFIYLDYNDKIDEKEELSRVAKFYNTKQLEHF